MRTTTAGEDTTNAAADFDVHGRVEYEDPDGNMVDLTAFKSTNWVVQGRWGETIDQPVLAGDLLLAEYQEDASETLSMYPLNEASDINRNAVAAYAPFLHPNRDIDIKVAVVNPGVTPSAGDWKTLVEGVTDRWYRAGGKTVGVRFRDRIGAQLASRWVETPTEYGTDAGRALESVIQDILDAWAPGITLVTIGSPSFLIPTYEQQRMPVLTAIRALAQERGWDLRVRWNDGAAAMRLTLYEPNRTASVPDVTFAPGRIISVDRLELGREWVRNAIITSYPHSSSPKTTTDATSITDYGRQPLFIDLGPRSPIDTDAEAVTFNNAVLSDLKDPIVEQRIEKMFFWPVELGDYYGFNALDPLTSTTQEFGVTEYEQRLDATDGAKFITRTRIGVRGKPAGAFLEWHRGRSVSSEANVADFLNFRDEELTTEAKFLWELNDAAVSVDVYDKLVTLPEVGNNWPDAASTPTTTILAAATQEYTTPWPLAGQVRLLQFVPKNATGVWGNFRRARITPGGLSVIVPAVQVGVDHTGSTATLTLSVEDPDSRVTVVKFKSKSGAGDLDASNPDDGSWTTDAAPYSHTETIAAKHGAVIAWAVGYNDENDTLVYLQGTHTFDADDIAEATSVEVSFSTTGTIVASPTGDEDCAQIHITASGTSTPADPTASDPFVSGRSGVLDTGVTCAPGATATVKARGRNSSGVFGPAQVSSAVRGIGPVNNKTVRIAAAAFRPDDNTTVFANSGSVLTYTQTSATSFFAPVILPPGAVINSLTAWWGRELAGDSLTMKLMYREAFNAAVEVDNFGYGTGTGQKSVTRGLNHTVIAAAYYVALDVQAASGGICDLYAVAFVYDSPEGTAISI